ncbi:MAG: AsmA-like C-terminal region-containing protein [Rhizobiaceae bacterium]
MAKRGITAFAVIAIIVVALVVALPFIASTQLVRDRIAQEFGSWSGYRVRLNNAPSISVWPSIKAELTGVALLGWGEDDSNPVLTSEKVEIDLSAIAALGGDIVPTRVHFQSPRLRISWADRDLPKPKSPAAGKIRWAIETARSAIAEDPENPNLKAVPAGTVGVVEFTDATVIDSGNDDRGIELLTSANGILQWPSFQSSMTLAANGDFNGEIVSVDMRVEQPLLLFAGGAAQLMASVESEPLQLSYEGMADTRDPFFLDGQLQTSTPSLRDLLEWLGADTEAIYAVGNASLSGGLKGQPGSFKIEDAEIALAESSGMGALEFAVREGRPAVSGTLAFEELDLVSFLSALAILPAPSSSGPGIDISSPAIGRLDLDLRLSADNVTAGPIALNEVAATVQINDNLATFDISDASGFGGNISTGFRVDRKSGRDSGEFRLLAADIDSGAFASALGVERMAPNARGKISIILNGPVDVPRLFLRTAGGSVAATFDTGTIADIDLPSFIERSKAGGFFALDEVADGTLAFERAELKASVENGVATIEKAEARTSDRLITLAGIVPYIGRSLALSGKVQSNEEGDDVPENLTFFVGGSWNSPFISAILTPPVTE